MYDTRLTLFLRRDLDQKKKVTRLTLFFIKKRLTPKKKVYATYARKKKLRDLRQKKKSDLRSFPQSSYASDFAPRSEALGIPDTAGVR